MRRALTLLTTAAVMFVCSCSPADRTGTAATASTEGDPLGPNAACYVCHMSFVGEQLTKTHLAKDVTCVGCHGLSAAHANDENIGATKPDRYFTRDQVDAACLSCHQDRTAHRDSVCTDCHGKHRIAAKP